MIETQKDQTCLNLDPKNIKPDVRVAYAEGLVLGVDEFVQEQYYHLQKDYLHNRGLHGYGTVYGLAVNIATSETAPPPDKKDKKVTSVPFKSEDAIWIKVEPGVGVDQQGRTFVLRDTYCINLKKWWQDLNSYENKEKYKDVPKPKIEDIKGEKHTSIYIRASYDEACDNLVALATQACSNGATTTANSRIYDSVKLELSAEKPVMSAWNLAQRFAWLISKIRFVPGINRNEELEKAIESYVRGSLANEVEDYEKQFNDWFKIWENPPNSGYIQLAEGTYTDEMINRLQRTYITDAAPNGHPTDAYEKQASVTGNAVLLAQLDLVGNFTETSLQALTLKQDEKERPYLLGTQTFQELANIGKRDKNRRRLFASLYVETSTSLLLWVHQPIAQQIKLKVADIVLKSDSGQLDFTIDDPTINNELYRINLIDGDSISADAIVQLTINLIEIKDAAGKSVNPSVFNECVGLNDDGSAISIYTFYALTDHLPVHSLADVSVHRDDTQALILDVGFNIDMGLEKEFTFATTAVQILKENTPVKYDYPRVVDKTKPLLRHFPITDKTVSSNDLLTIRFDTQQINVGTTKLSQLMTDNQYTFVGYDGQQYIDLPCVVNAPIQDIEAIIDANIKKLRTLPFATITPLSRGVGANENHLYYEIWPHLAPLADKNTADTAITLNEENLKIFAEQADNVNHIPVTFTLDKTTKPAYNNLIIVDPSSQVADQNFLRFVFLIDKINVGTVPFKEFMKGKNIKFDGSQIGSDSGDDSIIIYVRNPFGPRFEITPKQDVNINELAVAAPKAATPKSRARRTGGKT